MKKKVKKFGAGGDIVTALGVGLIGKALYDKYKEGKGKDDEESDYAKKVKEFRDSKKAAAEPAPEPAKKEEKEDKSMSREEYLEKRGAKPIRETGTFKGPDTAEPDLEYKSKPVVKTTPKKATPAAPRAKATDKVGAGYENVGKTSPKSVVFKDASAPAAKEATPAEAPAKIGSQGSFKFDSAPDLSVPKAFDMKSGNKTVYGTDTTSVFKKKAAQERAEAEEKAKKKEKDAAQAKEFRERSLQPMKKGGAVKKYASGGTVKSSASKRADGIAQRGKTRGRIY